MVMGSEFFEKVCVVCVRWGYVVGEDYYGKFVRVWVVSWWSGWWKERDIDGGGYGDVVIDGLEEEGKDRMDNEVVCVGEGGVVFGCEVDGLRKLEVIWFVGVNVFVDGVVECEEDSFKFKSWFFVCFFESGVVYEEWFF